MKQQGNGKRPPRLKGPQEPLNIPVDRIDAAGMLRHPSTDRTRLTMRQVRSRIYEGITVDVLNLDGAIVRHDPTLPLVLENVHSYTIAVHRGELGFSGESLATLLNRYTFAFPDSPVFGLRVSFEGGRMRLSGTLRRWVNVPFTIMGKPQVDKEGGIIIEAERIMVGKMRVAALMDLVKMRLESLVPPRSEYGVRVDGDTVRIDIPKLLPPPRFQVRVVDAIIGDGQLRVRLDDGIQSQAPAMIWPQSSSYTHLEGGDLLTGNILIKDLNMQLVSENEHQQLELSLQEYHRQSEAGFTVSRGGKMMVFIPPWATMEDREAGGASTPLIPVRTPVVPDHQA